MHTDPVVDARGSFYRGFCDQELKEILSGGQVRQVNVSHTKTMGAIRGLHFQYPPHTEIKLIRCLRGRVFDVAVDLRAGSPTFGKWYATELSDENHVMMVLPAGCAHGFQVLECSSELLYLHTAPYAPEAEGAIRYDDPAIAIEWPLAVTDISLRDQAHPYLDPTFEGVRL